ncbi:hypothetical protein SCP_0410470 [Sparassis crispa]|uniref:Uncharacterized protein n=1 Tax=Sparassis crispa TaxID=139825 RepID=A0A401GKI4_9APHY|nr:hypothetical protein SCP_0410470 [Sparassis crispa]GBE82662.1 hypothetical protein SCP_0410470 [Sparassis crispa]
MNPIVPAQAVAGGNVRTCPDCNAKYNIVDQKLHEETCDNDREVPALITVVSVQKVLMRNKFNNHMTVVKEYVEVLQV